MEDREQLLKSDPEFDRLAFTVLAIEASAQKMGISPSEMRKRLDKVGLIKSLIQDCYDTLHTESQEARVRRRRSVNSRRLISSTLLSLSITRS